MTEIKVLELMDAIQQTQKTADDMWRVLREVLEEQRNAQQSVHLTLLESGQNWSSYCSCAACKQRAAVVPQSR